MSELHISTTVPPRAHGRRAASATRRGVPPVVWPIGIIVLMVPLLVILIVSLVT